MGKEKRIILTQCYDSLCGKLLLGSLDNKLCMCDWLMEPHHNHIERRMKKLQNAELKEGTSPVIEQATAQLDEFFAGTRKTFDIPLLLAGTDFQRKVWNELQTIPFGHTISYRELAQRIDMPQAVRAVANANGANAISIFVPCHRVIGSNHSLTGYAGGLDAKRILLELEGICQI